MNATELPRGYIDLLQMLIRTPCVVGAEHSFFRILQRELEERGAQVNWYEGLLVASGSKPDSLMLSSHIDRHGLVCTGPNEFQFAAFVAGGRSDLLGNSVAESLMRKVVDRFATQPVFAYEPWSGGYLGQGAIDRSYICEYRKNLIFELEGLSWLVAGTPVAFTDKLVIDNGFMQGQLDNVLTAAVLVYLFELGFEGTAFFTAQEEAGKSWRYLLEWFRRFGGSTNQLIVVDTSPFPDQEAASEFQLVLRNKDANAEFNEELTARLNELCAAENALVQFKDVYVENLNRELIAQGEEPYSLGSTEMGRIINASNGLVDGTTLQIPTSGYHTMQETASSESVAAFIRVLRRLADC